MAGARAFLGAGVVVRVEEGVPRAEAVAVKKAFHDQVCFFLLERVARFAQKTGIFVGKDGNTTARSLS